MALHIHSPSYLINKKSNHHPLLYSPPKFKFTVQSQTPTPDPEPGSASPATEKPTPPGLGFGPSTTNNPASVSSKKKKQKGKRERASIIRRTPLEKPTFASQEIGEDKANEQSRNESAFLLAWLGLGGIILIQGLVLAASGLLPDEWDRFFVKYLYPSFTPTVGLFVAGTVAYGVIKYLQNEQLKDQK
ncbi:protein LPA2 [Mercurialis annua]|uniref:protein LPA2 n=1 Tax=Mercurialis annua TaxID=3986 RepID=UPI00215E1924|nr:protein LPA2 [Mercurialis annua]